MRWLLLLLRSLVAAIGAGARGPRSATTGGAARRGAVVRDALLDDLNASAGYRKRTLHTLVGRAREDNDDVAWSEDVFGYIDPETGVENEVSVRSVIECSCGSILGYSLSLQGICRTCGRTVCTAEGCSARCVVCGALVCAEHSVKDGKDAYCLRHRMVPVGRKMWRAWWGLD